MAKKNKEERAAYLIGSAIVGEEFKVILVAGKRYVIKPPTIRKIAGAAMYLSELDGEINALELLKDPLMINSACGALSWLIDGSDELTQPLSDGTPKEIADALMEAYSMIDVAPFIKLSVLAKNVSELTAHTRQ